MQTPIKELITEKELENLEKIKREDKTREARQALSVLQKKRLVSKKESREG